LHPVKINAEELTFGLLHLFTYVVLPCKSDVIMFFLQFYSIRFQFNGECYKEHKSRIILRTRFVYNYNTKEYLEWKINVFEKSDIKSLVETHSLTLFSLLYDIECFQIEFGDHKNFRRLYFAQKGSLCVLKFKKVEKNFLLYVPITFALHTQVCNTT
jgi:hypothetical protein